MKFKVLQRLEEETNRSGFFGKYFGPFDIRKVKAKHQLICCPPSSFDN